MARSFRTQTSSMVPNSPKAVWSWLSVMCLPHMMNSLKFAKSRFFQLGSMTWIWKVTVWKLAVGKKTWRHQLVNCGNLLLDFLPLNSNPRQKFIDFSIYRQHRLTDKIVIDNTMLWLSDSLPLRPSKLREHCSVFEQITVTDLWSSVVLLLRSWLISGVFYEFQKRVDELGSAGMCSDFFV